MDTELIAYTQPMSVLEAVNLMLRAIGEVPTSSLVGGGENADTEAAFAKLNEVSRATQGRGWYFNTETMTLSPTINGEVLLPLNTLDVDTTAEAGFIPGWDSSDADADQTLYGGGAVGASVVMRGNRLYDKGRNTFTFTNPVRVTLKLLLPFDELPQPARTYVAIKAAREFTNNHLSSGESHKIQLGDEQAALVALEQEDQANADYNIGRVGFIGRMRRRR